jgi:hypothetical protein
VITKIEIPDELLRKAKAATAQRGDTLREFITRTLETRLVKTSRPVTKRSGWRSVFGLAEAMTVARIDTLLAAEFEQVDPSQWR